MKLRVKWLCDKTIYPSHKKFLGKDSVSTSSPIITSKCIKVPSYIYSRIFVEIGSSTNEYISGIVKFIKEEDLKQVENEFINEWTGDWVSVKFYIGLILSYPTCKILSTRRLKEELIDYFGNKKEKPIPLFYKISCENKELNADLELPMDIPAFEQLKTLLEYKWKEK